MHGVNTYLQWNSIVPAQFWWLPAATLYRIPMCECKCVCVCACVAEGGVGRNMPETHSPKTSRWKQRETDNDVNCCDRCLSTPNPPPHHHHQNDKHTHTHKMLVLCLIAYYNSRCLSYHVSFPVLSRFFSIKQQKSLFLFLYAICLWNDEDALIRETATFISKEENLHIIFALMPTVQSIPAQTQLAFGQLLFPICVLNKRFSCVPHAQHACIFYENLSLYWIRHLCL